MTQKPVCCGRYISSSSSHQSLPREELWLHWCLAISLFSPFSPLLPFTPPPPLLLLLSRFSRVRPHRRQPTRLCCPWDSPGKNTGVHIPLRIIVKSTHEETLGTSLVVQWLRLCIPNAGDAGLIPCQGPKNSHAMQLSQKIKENFFKKLSVAP